MTDTVAQNEGLLLQFWRMVKRLIRGVLKYVRFKWVLPLVYRWNARKPIDEKLVIFADLRDRPMPDNFIGLHRMCKENGYRCEVFSGRPFSMTVSKWKRRWEKLKFDLKFVSQFAQCRALFLVEYFPLADIVTVREGTDVVQLWHGCGLMKRMGYAVTSGMWGMSEKEKKRYPMHTSYTLVSGTSPRVCDGYHEAFRCKRKVIKPLGSPRTDVYFDETFKDMVRQKVRDLIPDIGDRKIILYAPTFRGKSISQSYINLDLNYGEIKKALDDRYVLLVKFHPLMAFGGETEDADARGFVFDVSKTLTPEEALCAADILITDYSSILFEFLLLERPVISYIYDLEEYSRDRGLFSDYEDLAPGPYVRTQDELIKTLQTVDSWFDADRIRKYREEFMAACDGHSTQRIYEYVLGRTIDETEGA